MNASRDARTKLDLAVIGAPFLDLTFERLEAIPGVGEETLARALHICPGGTGMQAIGAARLGLSAGLAAPLGRRPLAQMVSGMLETEGVRLFDTEANDEATHGTGVPVTALLSTEAGVAMATVLNGKEPSPGDVEGIDARAVLVSLGRLHLAPRRARVYVVTGTLELPRVGEDLLARLRGTRAFMLNAAEAAAVTGRPEPAAAAAWLASRGTTAVVTLGPGGAVAAEGEHIERWIAPHVDALDATGAGDLFAAAYVWADLGGASLRDRLSWACLYASLSVQSPTAFDGAVARDVLLSAGRDAGLQPPPRARTA